MKATAKEIKTGSFWAGEITWEDDTPDALDLLIEDED